MYNYNIAVYTIANNKEKFEAFKIELSRQNNVSYKFIEITIT